jgi:hypothetical protein
VLLDIDVGTRRLFVELLHDDEEVPVADYRSIWDTYSVEQQSLISREAEALDLDGLAIFRVFAVHELADDFPHDRVDLFWNQGGSAFFRRVGLELPKENMRLAIPEDQLAGTAE